MHKHPYSLKTGSSIVLLCIAVLAFLVDAAPPADVLLYPLEGENLSSENSRDLTLKLTDLLQNEVRVRIAHPESVAESFPGELPLRCDDLQTANTAKKVTGITTIIWGDVELTGGVYRVTIQAVSGRDNQHSVFIEEIEGDIFEVATYAIHNVVMKMAGRPEDVRDPSDRGAAVTSFPLAGGNRNVGRKGVVRIVPSTQDAKIYFDGKLVGSGSMDLGATVGTHRVTAKTAKDSRTELIEVFENEVTPVSLEVGAGRSTYFFMGFDASWMLGEGKEFGPSHIVGFEIRKKHLVAINYYWGLPVFYSMMFGGGVQYLYTFNHRDRFLARLGGGAGFWWESGSYYYGYSEDCYDPYYGYYDCGNEGYSDALYFGGPKVRLELGGGKVFFTILDATMLIGPTRAKLLLNSGISFRL